MATSVKMLPRDKERLDRLQGEITVHRGRRLPQQAVLAWLLDLGEAQQRRWSNDADRPMSPREIAGLRRLVVRTGITTREEEIDATIARAVR